MQYGDRKQGQLPTAVVAQSKLSSESYSNDLGGTRAEHCGARVFLGCYAEPQLLIPPNSLQAEAYGGTIFVVN